MEFIEKFRCRNIHHINSNHISNQSNFSIVKLEKLLRRRDGICRKSQMRVIMILCQTFLASGHISMNMKTKSVPHGVWFFGIDSFKIINSFSGISIDPLPRGGSIYLSVFVTYSILNFYLDFSYVFRWIHETCMCCNRYMDWKWIKQIFQQKR